MTPGSPFVNFRIASRNFPFHSDHLYPVKLPIWYKPAASHASAINLVSANDTSSSRAHSTGGCFNGVPSSPLERTDPSSNRNPSTCISFTQNLRQSRINNATAGWLQLIVLPQPEKSK